MSAWSSTTWSGSRAGSARSTAGSQPASSTAATAPAANPLRRIQCLAQPPHRPVEPVALGERVDARVVTLAVGRDELQVGPHGYDLEHRGEVVACARDLLTEP